MAMSEYEPLDPGIVVPEGHPLANLAKLKEHFFDWVPASIRERDLVEAEKIATSAASTEFLKSLIFVGLRPEEKIEHLKTQSKTLVDSYLGAKNVSEDVKGLEGFTLIAQAKAYEVFDPLHGRDLSDKLLLLMVNHLIAAKDDKEAVRRVIEAVTDPNIKAVLIWQLDSAEYDE